MIRSWKAIKNNAGVGLGYKGNEIMLNESAVLKFTCRLFCRRLAIVDKAIDERRQLTEAEESEVQRIDAQAKTIHIVQFGRSWRFY